MKPKLKLVGEDGNAFSILARARQVLRRNGMGDKITEFTEEATSGDYDNVIATCAKWFEVS